jgi:glycosyltransferase involved in cell wall biosynthesis
VQFKPPRKRNQIKVVYAFICFDANSSGVYWKIKDQVSIWKNENLDVQLVIITDLKSSELWLDIDPKALLIFDNGILSKIKSRFKLLRLAIQQEPDILYFRDNFPINIPKASAPIVIEVQSLVKNELRARSFLRYIGFNLCKNFYYRNLTAAVFVSRELQRINEISLKTSQKFHISANGINLERFEQLPFISESIELIFIGHPNQPWHGIEDILELAANLSHLKFHIVGYDNKQVPDNVCTYKELKRSEYIELAKQCTLGISTLGLNVKGMSEASPLKSREYLALGLPIISRYEDTDFPEGRDFILRLPSDNRQISDFASEIETFANNWKGRRVGRNEISNIDVNAKERSRLDFFYSLLP